MSIQQIPPETQAGTTSGPARPPDTPVDVSDAPARTWPGLCAVLQAFLVPCPGCGTEVIFPFDPVLSAQLDQLLFLQEYHPQLLAFAAKELAR
jgi:hypothetical protein